MMTNGVFKASDLELFQGERPTSMLMTLNHRTNYNIEIDYGHGLSIFIRFLNVKNLLKMSV